MSEPATETTEPPAEEKPKRASSTTSYIVLEKIALEDAKVVLEKNEDEAWIEVGLFNARSTKEAVRAHLDKAKVEAGTFVAVPTRSFDPVTVKTETVARRTFA